MIPGVGGEGSEPPDQQADDEDPPDRQVPATAPGHVPQGQHNCQEPTQHKQSTQFGSRLQRWANR